MACVQRVHAGQLRGAREAAEAARREAKEREAETAALRAAAALDKERVEAALRFVAHQPTRRSNDRTAEYSLRVGAHK
eukprot:4458275-Pyramimonas_sp.AAC.2